MKKWIIGVALVMSAVASWSAVVISADFTIGGDNAEADVVVGSTTDVGNVVWRGNASGKFRYNSAQGDGGAAIPQNNLVDSDPRLYLDYAPIMDAGHVTTLSLKAQVADCESMSVGFGSDDNLMSSSTSAFWVRINSNGTVDMWKRTGEVNTKIFDGVQVKATMDDILEISVTYDQANNQVWGSVVGGVTNATLAATPLDFTPTFDQFNLELKDEGGTRINTAYFDDIVVDIEASSAYEIWVDSFGLSGSPDADADYDYDTDGFNNLYEYGLGGDPTNADVQGISPVYSVDENGTNLTYIHPQLSNPNSGLVYYLELTDNLLGGVWSNVGYTATGTNAPAGDFDYVTNNIPVDGDQKFIQLIIDTL